MVNLIQNIRLYIIFFASFIPILNIEFISSGIFQGVDWEWPYDTKDAFHVYLTNLILVNHQNFTFGSLASDNSTQGYFLFLALVFALFRGTLQTSGLIQQLLITGILAFSAFNFYRYIKIFKANNFLSLCAGLLFALNPFTYNLLVMGWIPILIGYSLFPIIAKLSFNFKLSEKPLVSKKVLLLIFTGMFLPVTLMWQAMLLSFIHVLSGNLYVINDIKKIIKNREFRSFFYSLKLFWPALCLIYFHLYWLIPRIIFRQSSSQLLTVKKSGPSQGMLENFSWFGFFDISESTFNDSFHQVSNTFTRLSWFIPFIIVVILMGRNITSNFLNKILVIFMTTFFLIIVLLYANFNILNSQSSFLNLFGLVLGRDPGRSNGLTLFLTLTMAVILISWTLSKSTQYNSRIIQFSLVFILVIMIIPWYNGKLIREIPLGNGALSLRDLSIGQNFSSIRNEIIQNNNTNFSVTHIPISDPIYHRNNELFSENFGTLQPISRRLLVPGLFTKNDKQTRVENSTTDYFRNLINSNSMDNIILAMRLVNSSVILVDQRALKESDYSIVENIKDSDFFETSPLSNSDFSIFELKNPNSHNFSNLPFLSDASNDFFLSLINVNSNFYFCNNNIEKILPLNKEVGYRVNKVTFSNTKQCKIPESKFAQFDTSINLKINDVSSNQSNKYNTVAFGVGNQIIVTQLALYLVFNIFFIFIFVALQFVKRKSNDRK